MAEAVAASIGIAIRNATESDIPRIAEIYAHHVLHGVATFEVEPPDPVEIGRRYRELVTCGFPYLVAQDGARVVGYAYAGPYRARAAYRYTVEDSIYIDAGAARRGAGRALLDALIGAATAAGFRQMIAVIGDSGNAGSIRVHERCGFAHIGTLPAVGFKFGRWVDSVLMQRPLGDGDRSLPQDTGSGG